MFQISTIISTHTHTVKSIVGAGVLSLPYGVAAFGNNPSALAPAIALIALMGVLSGYTFGLIGRVCQNTNTMSYSDAWDATVGKKFSPLIAFSCFIDCFAGNLSYSMILADTLQNLLASAGVAVTRTQSLLGVSSVVLLPLCLMKNLASLAPFSLVGIGGMLYTTLAMGFRWWSKAYAAPAGKFFTSQLATPVFGSKGAASALSFNALILTCMLSNAYIAHFNAPKFLKELKNNTMSRFHQVIGWSFATSIALYGAITGFGFLTFGAASNGLILNNYSTADTVMSLARIAVTISIIASYPLIFVGCRDGLFDLFKVPQEKRTNQVQNKMTLGVLGVVTLLASRLTDLGLVASVGGATFGTALVFVYPVIMFLKQQTKRTRESIPAALIGVLGVAMGAIGTALSLSGADI
jgi:amino acid permease